MPRQGPAATVGHGETWAYNVHVHVEWIWWNGHCVKQMLPIFYIVNSICIRTRCQLYLWRKWDVIISSSECVASFPTWKYLKLPISEWARQPSTTVKDFSNALWGNWDKKDSWCKFACNYFVTMCIKQIECRIFLVSYTFTSWPACQLKSLKMSFILKKVSI